MPRIREINLQPNVSASSPQRYASAEDFGGGAGQAMTRFGGLIDQLGQHYDETRRATSVNRAVADAQRELLDYSFTLQNGGMDENGRMIPPPDPTQHRTLFEAQVKTVQEKYGAGLDELGLAMFEEKFGPVALRETFAVRKNGLDLQKAAIGADLQQTLDTLADTYVDSDETMRPQIRTQALEVIIAAERAGVVDPAEGLKLRQQFADTTLRAGVMKLIRDDPDSAITALQSGEFQEMSPDETQRWIDTALRASERKIAAEAAEAERQERAAAKWQNDVEDATAEQGWTMHTDKTLTVEWVKANAGSLDKTDYRMLLEAASGGPPVVTDPVIYSDLRARHASGEDVTADATAAYRSGSLNREAFDKLTDTDLPSWQKDGEKFIATALKVSDFNPRIGAPERLASALDQWTQWSDAHPDATAAEARTEYKQIVEDHRLIDTSEQLATMPKPRFLSGSREKPDIAATVRETEKALAENRMTQEEFNDQMLLIEQWDLILESAEPEPGATTP